MKEIIDISKFIISQDESLDNILKLIEKGGEKILLVVDKNDHLLGSITDGDIRRELISNGLKGSSTAQKIINPDPIYTIEDNKNIWSEYFASKDIEHLVICNENIVVKKIIRYSPKKDILPKNVSVLIFAGGKGVRMGEKYSKLPKPIIELEGKSLIERIYQNLLNEGFNNISIALNHESEKIVNHLNSNISNNKFTYIIEKEPMGTAGGLFELIKHNNVEENILTVNSDILFQTNLTNLLNHHNELANDVTMGTAKYTYQVPYGVVNKDSSEKLSIEEKPIHKYNVLSGINLIKKSAIETLQPSSIDMDILIELLQEKNYSIGYYDIGSKWIDVGNEDSLNLAKKFLASNLI